MRLIIPSLLCLLAAAACIAVHGVAPSASPMGSQLGSWKQIEDVEDPHVKEIAGFAVSEHNKQSNSSLALEGVVSGKERVVAGESYLLWIDCKDAGCECVKRYEAVVWETPWQPSRRLVSFKAFVRDGGE